MGIQLKHIIEKRLPFSFTKIDGPSPDIFVYYKAVREGITIYLSIPLRTDKNLAAYYRERHWSPENPNDMLG